MKKVKVRIKTDGQVEINSYSAIVQSDKLIYHEKDYLVTIDLKKKCIIRHSNEYDIKILIEKEIIEIKLPEYEQFFVKPIKVIEYNESHGFHLKYYVLDEKYQVEYDIYF